MKMSTGSCRHEKELPHSLKQKRPTFSQKSPAFSPRNNTVATRGSYSRRPAAGMTIWASQNSRKFSPKRPRFSPNSRRFSPKRPRFSPERPKFYEKRPKFSPKSPKFSPKSPKFSPKRPKFFPKNRTFPGSSSWRLAVTGVEEGVSEEEGGGELWVAVCLCVCVCVPCTWPLLYPPILCIHD